ncbi:hypothetical protein mRhiFer1_008323 [Rhinolophus ferrumequinum]|uniref:Uncharacterized protein n=1 Tax=Rhinolophus ferrumequinum TaxID=59479 RepID=A0A7J7VR38_RHIFE|nr:hypothetical protein mRhiFer1_008323 [Rhinolophus ferrumequinum]
MRTDIRCLESLELALWRPPSPLGMLIPFPTTSYLFGVCSNAGTVPTSGWCVSGKPAPCTTEGRVVMGALSRGALRSWVRNRSSRQGRAAQVWSVPRCSHAPLVDASFFVTLQQDGSEGPECLFSVSMTIVLRLLESPHYSRF